MNPTTDFNISVFAGDGIGTEITKPCLDLLHQVAKRVGGFNLTTTELPAGASWYRDHGEALPKKSMDLARKADAILLAAMGLPAIRYPNGTEIAPQLNMRFDFGLYAGVRPVRRIPGLPVPLADPRAQNLDFVLVRESTEGLFSSYGRGRVIDDQRAEDTLVITRGISEKLFDFCFNLTRRRKACGSVGRLTCIDKANVFESFAFFRKIFDERAERFPDIESGHAYVDATALDMVRKPWEFDVLVTENMFGDILSDLGAGLVGGMGVAPSADIGDEHAVFQPCHGSAPDIMGQGKANPTAMFMSAAMMLDWLGERHDQPACIQAAALINLAIDRAFSDADLLPCDMGGVSGTGSICSAVSEAVEQIDLETAASVASI